MPTDPRIEGTEELREALLATQRERDAFALASSHGQQLLDALESLLGVESAGDPFDGVFRALHGLFVFEQALILAEDGPTLECIVADPPGPVGSRWPAGPLFRKVMGGRVVTTFSNAELEEWAGAERVGLSPAAAALYAPVGVRGRRGILMLVQPAGAEGFDRSHVALARKFSVLASHALATRYASQSEEESRSLRALTRQLRASEQQAKRNADLLNEIVNVLPVGVTVRDGAGDVVLVNDAAAMLEPEGDELHGVSPLWPGRRGPEIGAPDPSSCDRLASGECTREHTTGAGSDERTVLTTCKPVRIFDETLLISTTLDISDRKRFEDELARRAFHDQLTGLPNRALMAELVDTALQGHQRGGMFALAFIDLDNFKQVNDYYSHAIGDALLVAVADRISAQIRPTDTLARISGDEFLLLINPLGREDDLPGHVDHIVDTLKEPFVIEGHELLISASMGVSVYPLHGYDYEALRRSADSAMYRAKHERKGRASYFDMTMRLALTARMELEQRLRAAIRDRRFRAAFQPKVRIASGEIVGFEALIRWVEPDGTVHQPGSFIEMASELGLLDDITRFVLQDVADCLPRLTARYGEHISASVNVSPRQVGDVAFMHAFMDQLAESGLARRIVLELTEDALVATQRFQRRVLPRLRELGVRVSIDDFGTGYSSLSMLTDLTADEVKVDRAFVTAIHERPRSQGILKAIESLCSALDVDIVAEGVETPEELAYLRSSTSIGLAQGFHFASPQFIDALVPRAGAVLGLVSP